MQTLRPDGAVGAFLEIAGVSGYNSLMENVKALIISDVEFRRQELSELSMKIHDNPELGFQEFKAVDWLTEYLKANGFTIEKGIYNLPTAFKGSYGEGRPAIALLAEYDALPELGHACGHNIIGTAAVGAALAARKAVDKYGGSVLVLGTPAEELHGGKVLMIERGAFKDIDAAMMVHPDVYDAATIRALACQTLKVEFFGKAAHAAASPEEGINALEAIIQAYNAINSLRQHIRSTARVHGIITDGGQAANIVPAHSAGDFIVRAMEDDYLEELRQKVLNCFVGAATATGARLEYKWGQLRYASMASNITLAQTFKANLDSLGRNTALMPESCAFGSTDMGNVSHVVPGIHSAIAIAPGGIPLHSPEFAEAAASEDAVQGIIDAAAAMALTVADLLANPDLMKKVKEEFQEAK